MLDVFKIKPFDLEPVYASWPDAPTFNGGKGQSVDAWLDQIKDGCTARKVPEEYWYEVAQHYMGPHARARLDAFKRVLYQMNGGGYRWTWKQFRAAMCNMGWDIEDDATETVEVKSKPFSSWFTVKRKKSTPLSEEPEQIDEDELAPPPPPKKPSPRSKSAPEVSTTDAAGTSRPRPPIRSATLGFFPVRRNSKSSAVAESGNGSGDPQAPALPVVKPELAKAMSDTVVETMKHLAPSKAHTIDAISSAHSGQDAVVTTIAHAPAWLLQASNAIEMLTKEHPKTMSALSAILITAGSIPALPAVAASPMGPILACHAAQAIGSIAVGLGTLLKASSQGQIQASTPPSSSSSSSSK
ncbi:hypothetical protein GLOTRDRAFT_40740 [Gloeophyllum trabeum ATCC 11539]|uniref:Uncharacterized protein n=1 Tax=Gloeophyllum trabeum (strain ATCC 11539 / FP-39264 / Madison 617) TaxID=670483 RepID=S7Q801_GLOTA|nr:uncharacterized protein GLOTRDRAFT_40740 [Gloeophyllum trabeum ATCC 11539]EPQ55657.1 hypothetical protein GLOTRDRAFT_40740 [Gloeophyllum trabeum ATCC 11539]